jgi:hypothetical protein
MPKRSSKQKTDQPPIPKHGAHPKYEKKQMPAVSPPADPEDPLVEESIEGDQLLWENEDERDLRPEWEDPDAPTSL